MDLCHFYTTFTLHFDLMLANINGWIAMILAFIARVMPVPDGAGFAAAFNAAKTVVDKRRLVQEKIAKLRKAGKKAAGAGAAVAPWVQQAISALELLLHMLRELETITKHRDELAAKKQKYCG